MSDKLWKKKIGLSSFFLFILILYLNTTPFLFSEGEDGLTYIQNIKIATLSALFHPNHILYNPVNWIFFQILSLFGHEESLVFMMRVLNILFSIWSLYVCYMITQRTRLSAFITYFILFGMSFSYGFWIYSLQTETYIFPLPFICLCLLEVIRISGNPNSLKSYALLSLYTIFAVLFHQQQILLVPVITATLIALFYFRKIAVTRKTFFLQLVSYLGLSGFSIVLTYSVIAVFVGKASSIYEIINWTKGLANVHETNNLNLNSIIYSLIGIFKTLWGGYFLFYYDIFTKFLDTSFPTKILIEEKYLSETMHPISTSMVTIALFINMFCFSYIVFRLITSRKNDTDQPKESIFFAIKCFWWFMVIIYGSFIIWWEPYNIEFWIALIPFFYIFLGINLAKVYKGKTLNGFITCFLITLFFVNLYGNVIPQTKEDGDFWYQNIKYLSKNSKKRDIVIIGIIQNENQSKPFDYLLENYLSFYVNAEVIYLNTYSLPEISKLIQENKTKNIFLSSWLFQFPTINRRVAENQIEWKALKKHIIAMGGSIEEVNQTTEQILWKISFP